MWQKPQNTFHVCTIVSLHARLYAHSSTSPSSPATSVCSHVKLLPVLELTKRNCGGQISKCLKLCPGLKFKTDFHSKMSACRHELGVQPQPPGNSNPAYYHHSVPTWLPSQLIQAMRAPDISQALFRNKRFIYLTSSVMCRWRAVPQR